MDPQWAQMSGAVEWWHFRLTQGLVLNGSNYLDLMAV